MDQLDNLKIVLLLAIGFTAACILGYITDRLKLSSILGYLVAGYLIGPYSPGIVIDIESAKQLAEIGVILMMFGVGLHFKLGELVSVQRIAIPGAVGQTAVAALSCTGFMYFLGWPIEAGIIAGFAVGVASTVVLVRVLIDNGLLNTHHGHVAVGWLIVEDIMTVILLILLPAFATTFQGPTAHSGNLPVAILIALIKFAALFAIVATVGLRSVTWVLRKIARTRSHELLTVAILAITLVIALGSSLFFGVSIALGAFIAGMVIGKTDIRHQAFAQSLPIKDAFMVIFFLSVGALFNFAAIQQNSMLFVGILLIILLLKPLAAFFITTLLGQPIKTAVIVALSLAQIGEFSFILAEEAFKLNIFPITCYDIIVAAAIVTIGINPLLFKIAKKCTRFLNTRYPSKLQEGKIDDEHSFIDNRHKAICIGYGPIGEHVTQTLDAMGFCPVIVEHNIDTVEELNKKHVLAIFGDATDNSVLKAAGIHEAKFVVITIPDSQASIEIAKNIRRQNSKIKILSRARYTSEVPLLQKAGVSFISCDEEISLNHFDSILHHLCH